MRSPERPAVTEHAPLRLASRLDGLGLSTIVQITERAKTLQASGRPVIVLGAGEPDFDTPEHIKDAARDALDAGETKYTATAGTAALKEAVRSKFLRENGLLFRADEVMVSAGAKQIIFNAFAATLEPGDEVILIAPFWTSYADIVRLCGGQPVIVETTYASGFQVTPEALRQAITPRTRWVVLNSPSNPAGAMYDEPALQALCDVLLDAPGVWLLSDDIYEHVLYDGRMFRTAAAIQPALKPRTLTLNGVSKAYAMTGWRIGYAGGPAALIQAMTTVQGQVTSCAASVSQAAAIAALEGPQDLVRQRARKFQKRRDQVVEAINRVDGLRCRPPEGAFYLYVNCEGWIGKLTPDKRTLSSDDAVCTFLLESHDVAVVPGSAFGLSPYFRISYAASDAELDAACQRIRRAASTLT